jgi:hypothetical protein
LLLLCSIACLTFSGCYHQVIQTGRTAGSTVVDKPMVATWLWGLVPAKELDVRSQCPSGVAVIETEATFMNGLLAVVTFGIFTPRHVKVTCASGAAALPTNAHTITIAADASAEDRAEVLRAAMQRSLDLNAPVVLRF